MIFIGSFESYSTMINNENVSFFKKTSNLKRASEEVLQYFMMKLF